MYDLDAVTTVAQIRGLLDAGLSTDTIRQMLPCAQGITPTIEPCPEVLATLGAELRKLATTRAALHQS